MTTQSSETTSASKRDSIRLETPAPRTKLIGRGLLVNTDCLEWMRERSPNSIHAVVTDPPYGLREFNEVEKAKLRAGRGGVWRIPPEFDGCKRMPLPRFTTLTAKEQQAMKDFFTEMGPPRSSRARTWRTRLHRRQSPCFASRIQADDEKWL